MRTLNERFDNANRPVKVTVTVPVQTLIGLEGLARQFGMSRRQALEEAVGDWTVRHEQSLNRQDRLVIQRALREAMDKQPVEELLDRFRKQMGSAPPRMVEAPRKDFVQPLTAHPRLARLPQMSHQVIGREAQGERIEQRRRALGMSREALGAAAGGMASATVTRVERGQVKAHPRTIVALVAALDQAEQEAAAA